MRSGHGSEGGCGTSRRPFKVSFVLVEPLTEFLRLLNANGVDYAVVGGHAVMFHGYPRSTQDLDILYRQSSDNAALERVRVSESY